MSILTRLPSASALRVALRPCPRLRSIPVGRRALRVSSRSSAAQASLVVNQDRLWDTLHHTAQWGDSKDGGVRRLALTEEDKAVREWFVDEAAKCGATVKVDEMGNQFAIRPGRNNDLPPIGIGSHLDTQPAGGRYDGILGVQAGLELLKVLHENKHETYAPIAVVSKSTSTQSLFLLDKMLTAPPDWANEEGARFKTGMLASAVWADQVTLEDAYNHLDTDGISYKEALEKIGFLGPVKASYKNNPLSAHFEYHIEQGPVLEDSNRSVGIVTGVQGMLWLMVNVKGRSQHCGTTPIDRRRDALLAACQMISRVNDVAWENKGLTTVGVFKSDPQSPGTIPGEVTFSVDIEHLDNKTMDNMAKSVNSICEHIAQKHGCTVEVKNIWRSGAVKFDDRCVDAVRSSAAELVGLDQTVELPAGAGHDSVNTSYHCPTGMIFIPSRDGISHHPSEYSTPEHW